MKTLAALFPLFFLSNNELSTLRKLLPLVGNGEPYAQALIRQSTFQHNQRVARAYKGVAIMAMAKYAPLPQQKFRLFKKGRQLLDSCINSDTLDPEPRFLRLTVQQNAPHFLNYRNNLVADRAYLRSKAGKLTRTDPELAAMIGSYLKK